jgi:hypothetical protein
MVSKKVAANGSGIGVVGDLKALQFNTTQM